MLLRPKKERAVQRIAAVVVMVPRSGRWAELDYDGVFAGAEDGRK